MKKLSIVGYIQLILIVCTIVLIPLFIEKKIDLNILAIIISTLSLIIGLLNEVNKAIEANKKSYVIRLEPQLMNINLGELIEQKVNNLRNQNYMIDSIKIINNKQRPTSDEVIILYH